MNPISSVHICGAGGIGTSGLALLFHEAGCHVTATDMRESEITALLVAAGIEFDTKPRKDWVAKAQCVVTPASFPHDHEELRAANDLHIPVVTRTHALLSSFSDHLRRYVVSRQNGFDFIGHVPRGWLLFGPFLARTFACALRTPNHYGSR